VKHPIFDRFRDKFIDAPPEFDPIFSDVIPLMPLQQWHGKTWAEFSTNARNQVVNNAAAGDVKTPLFTDDEGKPRLDWPHEESKGRLVGVCRSAIWPGTKEIPEALESLTTLEVFLNILPRENVRQLFGIPTHEVEEHLAEFMWSRARVFFSGFGHQFWTGIAARLQEHYPACPFQGGETEDQWMKLLKAARHACGWPVTSVWVPFMDIPWYGTFNGKGEAPTPVPAWLKACAIVHVLKHARWTDAEQMDILCAGRFLRMKLLSSQLESCKHAVGLLHNSPEGSSHEKALLHAMSCLEHTDLIHRSDLGLLPGNALAGAYSRPIPSGNPAGSGWYSHGCVMANVYQMNMDRVAQSRGDDELIMGFRWGDVAPQSEDARDSAVALKGAIPSTVPSGSPSEYLRQVFPNWILNKNEKSGAVETDADLAKLTLHNMAVFAWFDSLLCVDVIRQFVKATNEFPLVAAFPYQPSELTSINQGKTTLAECFARAFVFDLKRVGVPVSSSAPDMRVITGILRQWGTAVLDEFVMPDDNAHPLSHHQLAQLATGGSCTSGLVLENNVPFKLRHPLFFSAKALEMTADLHSRLFPIFLDQLDDKARSNANMTRKISSGQVSITMRLMAWRLTQSLDLATKINKDLNLPSGAAPVNRFVIHRTCASHLLAHYLKDAIPGVTAAECAPVIDATLESLQGDAQAHSAKAEALGLFESMRAGRSISLPWYGLWRDIGVAVLRAVLNQSRAEAVYIGEAKWCPAGKVLMAYSEAREFKTLRMMLENLTSCRGRFGQTQIVGAFATHARVAYRGNITTNPCHPIWMELPGQPQWEAACYVDSNGAVFFNFRTTP
jgi:hypothetical protein